MKKHDNQQDSSYPPLEHEMEGRLHNNIVAQSNWYSCTPDEMYFAIKNETLETLDKHIMDYFKASKGSDEELVQRDEQYMKFYKWILSDEFSQEMGPDYIFCEPYVVGSSWTPLRTDESEIDVIVCVRGPNKTLDTVPQQARDKFVQAVFKQYAINMGELVSVTDNKITVVSLSCYIHIRLTANYNPSFGARLTAAISIYDDFLEEFSQLARFVQHWFQSLRKSFNGTARLAIPSSYSVMCLLIHFLQHYELIPNLFNNSPLASLHAQQLETIYKNKCPGYTADLYRQYQDFEALRRDRPPRIADIFVMFIYHFGYLADLPHMVVQLVPNKLIEKNDTSNVGLCLRTDEIHGSEVPDAFRLQYLLRDAFKLIKDCQNPKKLVERLFNLRLDASFNGMRDREMYRDPYTARLIKMEYMNTVDYQQPQNHKEVTQGDSYFSAVCAKTKYFIRDRNIGQKKPEDDFVPFCDQHHALKDFLQRPPHFQGKSATLEQLKERAEKMFMVTVLPNPNQFAELSVIFRPPNSRETRLTPIDDPTLENAPVEKTPIRENEIKYIDLVKTHCFKEMKKVSDMRMAIRANAYIEKENMLPKSSEDGGETNGDEPTPSEESKGFSRTYTLLDPIADNHLTTAFMTVELQQFLQKSKLKQAFPETDFHKGASRIVTFVDHVGDLRESYLTETAPHLSSEIRYSKLSEFF